MCPARAVKKESTYMPDQLFKKIIEELAEYNFDGNLHVYGQADPLLDKKIFERIDYSHKSLPNAKIHLISTLNHLTDEMIDKLISAPLERVATSIYELDANTFLKIRGSRKFKEKLTNTIKFAKKWASVQPYEFCIHFFECDFNRQEAEFIKHFLEIIPCTLTQMSLHPISLRGVIKKKRDSWRFGTCMYSVPKITGDGNVSICFFDTNSDLKIGNVKNNSFWELLSSKNSCSLRRDILFRRSNISEKFCDVCDCAENHTLFFFLPIHKVINKIPFLPYFNSVVRPDQTKMRHSSMDVEKKLISFNELFGNNSDEWLDVIANLRNDFYKSTDS
jgi:MoaA/NifB/PqqE/SkfB family radical SAM enzyme